MSTTEFPRTEVGGVSLPRLIIGTNWFRGYSHTSLAKDRFIKEHQTPERVAEILSVFMAAGIDAVLGGDLHGPMREAIARAEQRAGRPLIRLLTPHLAIRPNDPPDQEPERIIAACKEMGAAFCLPHQATTDALVDRRSKTIRDLDPITRLIRRYDMIPGLSTHMPETIPYADAQGADIETYIQLYNAAGFLMQVEADWVMRIISEAAKPVITIKPLAAGRLLPPVGLAFVWSTIRPCDMVCIGTTTPDEAREVIDISTALLEHRVPGVDLQSTRSKNSLKKSGA
jgi:hypothetical protein